MFAWKHGGLVVHMLARGVIDYRIVSSLRLTVATKSSSVARSLKLRRIYLD